ncbi:hypothetical protein ACJJIF_11080 [Microbulbifer sp. SSSA002]|uniref:hypothetical protein n=1 Tax=unclassified Microbulbifer TaxID=2619833 RepID=UPI00403A0570
MKKSPAKAKPLIRVKRPSRINLNAKKPTFIIQAIFIAAPPAQEQMKEEKDKVNYPGAPQAGKNM